MAIYIEKVGILISVDTGRKEYMLRTEKGSAIFRVPDSWLREEFIRKYMGVGLKIILKDNLAIKLERVEK